jgi:tRNA G10  N-methylase Trm11
MIERLTLGAAGSVIGVDDAADAIACAQSNLDAYRASVPTQRRQPSFELRQVDVAATGLADASADAVVCDLPFGNLVGSRRDTVTLYPAVFDEAHRLLRADGRFIVISSEITLLEKLTGRMAQKHWSVDETFRLNQAGLKLMLVALRKRA